jgi:hypothetical protein
LPSAAPAVAAEEKSNCPPPPLSTTAIVHLHQCQCGIHQRELFILKMTCLATRVWIEVVQWDCSLSSTKTFKTAVLILSGRKFESPNLESLQKILHLFINEPTSDYFKKKSSHATAFENIQAACKAGWKSEATCKKKWSVRFTAEHLAFLLVL